MVAPAGPVGVPLSESMKEPVVHMVAGDAFMVPAVGSASTLTNEVPATQPITDNV